MTLWRWPVRGSPKEEISAGLEEAKESNVDYLNDIVLGFPGTPPLAEAVEAFNAFIRLHPNNIGCHTRRDGAEYGFKGTQLLEREFIWRLANLLGSEEPDKEIDGYICGGGTEGNHMGLWVGRNKLLYDFDSTGSGSEVVLLTTFLTHFSDNKVCNQLGLKKYVLPTNPRGELEPQVVEEKIRMLHGRGTRRFLIMLNAGTINMGSIDPVARVCEMLRHLERELASNGGVAFYVHVDAAYGGYVIPFLEPFCEFAFHPGNDVVQSVCVDPQKMGYVPYPAGVFLCRKDLMHYVQLRAGYVGGHVDETLCGSRPGASAAACWAAMQALGSEGYTERLSECMEVLGHLQQGLCELSEDVKLYPARMNIQTVRFPEHITQTLLMKDPRQDNGRSLAEKYCLPSDEFPSDFSRPDSTREKVFRFIAMPHLTVEKVDAFLALLRQRVGG